MVRLKHPTLSDVHLEVEEDQVADAVKAGWVDTRRRKPTTKTRRKK